MGTILKNELDGLRRKLLSVGALVEQNVDRAIVAIERKDENLARLIIDGDSEIDSKEVEVEEDCLKVLALHQPVATDLRIVIATLKINNDLERVGDLATNIAHRAIYLAQKNPVPIPFEYERMAGNVRKMLKESLDAFVTLDLPLARQVCELDEEVDQANREMYNQVYYGIKSNPELVEQLVHYLSVSRNLERIGDYATNIAEDVIYMIEGKIVRHGSREGLF